ncbi:MAG: hypothetical protein WC782_08430 [Methylococcaceae bacterium]|jgi:hypothetical protein
MKKKKTVIRKQDKTKPLLNFVIGLSNIFPTPMRDYPDPTLGGFTADYKAMQNDFRAVAKDMRKAIKKYEQTTAN